MSTSQHGNQGDLILTANQVVLRDALPDDADNYVGWIRSGEWREFDAPWERLAANTNQYLLRANFEQRFLLDRKTPRGKLIIATPGSYPIGWVNRYVEPRFSDFWLVGICICEDQYLGHGLGSEALKLWIDYLFENSEIHRLGLATYSFNPRMIRVAERLGFKHEGTDRQIINWRGQWHDRLHYGMLRSEWEELRGR
jgi:RimJ/RimL family protein N-acetyltransferase